MQTFDNNTACAEIAIEVLPCQTFTHVQSVIDVSLQMGVPFPGRVLYLSAGRAHPHRVRDTVWFLQQATPEFMSRHQTAQTSVWWHTLSVAFSIAYLAYQSSKCR